MNKPRIQTPRVAAAVAAYRRDRELERLAVSLRKATVPPARIIVADGASSPESRDTCARLGAEWVPLPANRGPGPAWNTAIAAALADDSTTHILVLDDDVVLPPDAVEALVRAATSTGCGAVAPLLFDEKGMLWGLPEPEEKALRNVIRRTTGKASTLAELGTDPHRFCWATGACMLYRRDVFEKCGMFREDFWMLGEDLEFSMRAAAATGGVFTAQVAVDHLPPPARDPRASALQSRKKFLALLQNLSFLSFHSIHRAHLRSYLAGNFRRYLRTEGCGAATLREASEAFWQGAVRGQPAGTPSGDRIRRRADRHFKARHFRE